jgi:hypothetical protein
MAHQHYTGTGKMHSFRGLLVDGGQERIRIQGATGEIAWRIVKFQTISQDPVSTAAKSVIKIYREEQTLPTTSTIDFREDELLGVAVWTTGADAIVNPEDLNVIFDNALFVRNIWVTHQNKTGSDSCNYYIELEEVKVSAAGMAQLSVAAARRVYVPGT